jgi:MFS family permease
MPATEDPDSPPRPPRKRLSVNSKRRSGMRYSLYEGAFATVHIVLTGGKFLVGYAYLLGANAFHIGLLSAIPFSFQALQLVSAYWTNRTGHRKVICFWNTLIARNVWVFFIFLPFLHFLTPIQKISFFLLLFSLASMAAVLSANAWTTWMSDLVPEGIRGRYLGFRNAILLVVIIVVDKVASEFLEYLHGLGHAREGFAILITVAIIGASLALWFLRKQYEPPMLQQKGPPLRDLISDVFAHKNFCKIALYFGFWNFGIGISSAFFTAHMLTYLQMTYPQIWVYTLISGIVGFAAYYVWGKWLDLAGTKTVMLSNAMLICTLPVIWLFPTPGHFHVLFLDALITGFCWTGFNIAAFNLPLILTPEKGRAYYLAIFLAISGMAFGLASFLGGAIAHLLQNLRVQVFGLTFINFHILFLISMGFRFASLVFLIRIEEQTSKGLIYLSQIMGNGVQKAGFTVKQFVFAPFDRFAKKEDSNNGNHNRS